jgi:hypothetical protein
MHRNKFVIKNKNSDPWSKFLFREVAKDERRPQGSGWMDLHELEKICGISFHTLRVVLNDLRQKGKCELYSGNIRNEKGWMQKHVWYKLKTTNWNTFFKNRQYQKDNQRLPEGKNWYTVKDLEKKTGFARSKILRLMKSHKVSNSVKVFDGYRFNPKKNKLERKIWYKLCQNGLNS